VKAHPRKQRESRKAPVTDLAGRDLSAPSVMFYTVARDRL
jgi:hypothetical protein